MNFDYDAAFQRTLGWVTKAELHILRNKRVAIAGCGGVGGRYVLTLARLGVGKLTIADMDSFSIENFNRQVGATMSTVGRPKVEVMAEMAREINPEMDIRVINGPIDASNIDQFLQDADLYLDGLDFWAFEARKTVFEACEKKGIATVTTAPFGMGAALISFKPSGMTFEKYFRVKDYPLEEQAIRLLIGLAPRTLQKPYLVDQSYVDLANHKGPSTPMACDLCVGLGCTQALKILLGRGEVYYAPWTLQFDAYRNKLVKTWRPWGNRNPLQLFILAVIKKFLRKSNP